MAMASLFRLINNFGRPKPYLTSQSEKSINYISSGQAASLTKE